MKKGLFTKIVAIRARKTPNIFIEKPLYPQRVNVWCGFWAGGIIGPFFKNEAGAAALVNGLRYRAMINELMNFKTIFHSPWKCSYRNVIADNTSVLYFKMKKIAKFLLKGS